MKKIVNTNIRFDLTKEPDRKAWEYLQKMDRKKHKSYTRAVITALVNYFEQEEAISKDPYLETREKEDAFLKKIEQAVAEGIAYTADRMAVNRQLEVLLDELKEIK